MNLADERWQHVRILGIIVVAGTVQVGRHRGEVACAVLPVVRPAHFDAGNLGQRIGAIRCLQRAGQQVLFAYRLRTITRVNARRSEKQQPLYAGTPRLMDNIGLNRKIDFNELGRVRVVGNDTADFPRGEEYTIRALVGKKLTRCMLVGQIEFSVRASDQIRVTAALQAAHERRPGQSGVARNVDSIVDPHRAYSL